eukprot:140757_1
MQQTNQKSQVSTSNNLSKSLPSRKRILHSTTESDITSHVSNPNKIIITAPRKKRRSNFKNMKFKRDITIQKTKQTHQTPLADHHQKSFSHSSSTPKKKKKITPSQKKKKKKK